MRTRKMLSLFLLLCMAYHSGVTGYGITGSRYYKVATTSTGIRMNLNLSLNMSSSSSRRTINVSRFPSSSLSCGTYLTRSASCCVNFCNLSGQWKRDGNRNKCTHFKNRFGPGYPILSTQLHSSSNDDTNENTNGDNDKNDDPNQSSKKGNISKSNNTGKKKKKGRPAWALDWMPTPLITLHPLLQLFALLVMYIFHLTVLTQHQIIFPFQLIPNDAGKFQSLGLDSVAGMISFAGMVYLNRAGKKHGKSALVPNLWSGPSNYNNNPKYNRYAPWNFPKNAKSKTKVKSNKNDTNDNNSKTSSLSSPPSPRLTSMVALALLTRCYFYTGNLAFFFERILYSLAGIGFPLTIAMHRSLVVLLGHLAWVAIGSIILKVVLRPQPFFGGGFRHRTSLTKNKQKSESKTSPTERKRSKKALKYKWYTNKWDTYWLWWTIGGYFVSSWFFNIADFLNQIILPPQVFEYAGEGVVSQLINPENNDLAASLVGYIAPCISAPWWEEVLYRGFMLPALCLQMKFWPAVFVSGIIFSIHHVSTTGAIPLAILGWTWATIYAKSGNLLVTILIHAMWNSRVFFGSWLGL